MKKRTEQSMVWIMRRRTAVVINCMMTSSEGGGGDSPVTGEFPSQRPVAIVPIMTSL